MNPVVVVGAGGIGCAVGYALRAAGLPILFVEASRKKIEVARRREQPVRVNDRLGNPIGSCNAEFVHFEEWQPIPESWVLLCTKCYHNDAVLNRLKVPVRLIPIQNGFDTRLSTHGHEYEGVASFVSVCKTGESVTRLTRNGDLHLGPRATGTKVDAEFSRLVAAIGQCRLFRVKVASDIGPIKHSKLMYNSAISPLAAAAGIDNGKLLSVPAARKLFFTLLQENHRILNAAGIELGKIGPFHTSTVAWILRRKWLAGVMARFFEPSLRGTYCSMAGEIQKGHTEIDNYNGHLIRLAEQHGVPCPLNRAVFELVVRMTAERMQPHEMVFAVLASEMREHGAYTPRPPSRDSISS